MFGVGIKSIDLSLITQRQLLNTRRLTTSQLLLKKASSSKKNARGSQSKNADASEEIVDISEFLKRAQNSFENTLELHKKKSNEFRQGVANPRIFDELKLQNGSKFPEVASTSSKGKNALLVTVYDPKDTKQVISAIMAAGLNLNPERIPNNDQQLKISLPPMTTEVRTRMCRDLKKIFEEYKNSSCKDSLGYVRGEILKDLKKLAKQNDSVRKAVQDVEKVHKEYVNKMQQQLAQAEKNVMNN